MADHGFVKRADQGGRRWVKGEEALKLVVKVNTAREVRTPYTHIISTS